MKSILNSSFHYTSSAETDLRKTFAKIRRKLREDAERRAQIEAEAKYKVSPIKQPTKITAV
jgi:hypothetical protein